MAFDYDENGTPVGVAGGFNYDENGRPIVTSEKDPGYLGDTLRGLKHGVEVTLPESTGKALQFFGADETGQKLVDYAKSNDTPDLQESAVGKSNDKWYSVRGNVYEAGDNAVLSMAPGAAGAAVGAGIGMFGGPGGAALGALTGYAVGSIASLPIFYGSQAKEAYDAVLKHQVEDLGTPLEEAHRIARNTGHVEGAIEAGGELAQDIIPFAKLFKPFGKPITKAVVSSVLKPTLAAAGKTVGEVVGGEVATEMAQQAGEDAVRKAIGDTGPGATWEETSKVIVPTALMSVLPGGAGAGAKHYQQTVALNALSSPETDADMRAKIAVGAAAAMADGNPDVSRAFAKYASDQIAAKAPIEIKDDDQFYLQYRLTSAQSFEEAKAAAEAALAAPVDNLMEPSINEWKTENLDAPALPYYAGEPLVTFPDGTTMTRAEYEQRDSGLGPMPALMNAAAYNAPLLAATAQQSQDRLATVQDDEGTTGIETLRPKTILKRAASSIDDTELRAILADPATSAVTARAIHAELAARERAATPTFEGTGGTNNQHTVSTMGGTAMTVPTAAPAKTNTVAEAVAILRTPVEQRVPADAMRLRNVAERVGPAVMKGIEQFVKGPALLTREQRVAIERLISTDARTAPAAKAVPETLTPQVRLQQLADNEVGQFSQPRPRFGLNSQLRSETGPDIKGEKVTRNMRRFLSSLARLTGTKIVYEFAPEESDGAVPIVSENTIHINTAAVVNPAQVMGHEITHLLKYRHEAAWNKMRDALVATMPDKKAGLRTFAENYWGKKDKDGNPNPRLEAAFAIDNWSRQLTDDEKVTLNSNQNTIEDFLLDEMVSDLGGSHWSSEQFWTDVFAKIEKQYGSEKAKGIIQRLVAAIKEAFAKALTVVRANDQFDFQTITPEQLTATRDAVTSAFAEFMSAERRNEPEGHTQDTEHRISTSALHGHTREGGEPTPKPVPERQQAQPVPAANTGDELDSARVRELAALSSGRTKPSWWNEPSTNAFAKGMTAGEVIQDALDRATSNGNLKQDGDKYVFYHATPDKTLTELRAGSQLEYNAKDAKHHARHNRGLRLKDVVAHELHLLPEQLNPPSGPWFSLRDAVRLSPGRTAKDQRLFFEVAPNPNDKAAVAAWKKRTDSDKRKVSNDVVSRIIPGLLSDIGVTGKVVTQLGGWMDDTNPSFALVVSDGDPLLAARAIGYVLDQEAVYALGLKSFTGAEKTGIIHIDIAGKDAHKIYMQFRALDKKVISGHSTIGDEMLIGLPIDRMNELEQDIDAIARREDVLVSLDEGYGATIKDYGYGIRTATRNTGKLDTQERDVDKWRTEARDATNAGSSGSDRAFPRSEIRPSYGKAIDQHAGTITGVHYSTGKRTELNSEFYGTGYRGAERARLAGATDTRIKRRIYFYTNTGTGITPESGVGYHAHSVDLNNLYNGDADPLNLWESGDANKFESNVIDAGYDGYYTRNFGKNGAAVLLGAHTVPVAYEGVGARPDVPRMSEARQLAALQKIENGKLTMDGEYGYNTFRSLWKDAEEMRAEYPDERTYDLYKDNGGTGVVYGAGGYNRYAVTQDGTLRPIPESFSNKDKLAEAQAALAEMARMSENRLPPPAPWYYSALGKAAETAAMRQAPASGWKDWLKSLPAKGVKPDEIKWSGIEEWLDVQGKQPVTREQVQSFLSEFGVKVETILRGERNPRSSAVVSQEIDADEEPVELDIRFGEWEIDEPDESWLRESAGERLSDEIASRVDNTWEDYVADVTNDVFDTNNGYIRPEDFVDEVRRDMGALFEPSEKEVQAEARRRSIITAAYANWEQFADDPDITFDTGTEEQIEEAFDRAIAVASGDLQAIEEEARRRARAEIDEDSFLEQLIENERTYYYDDYDSPQTRRIRVDGVDSNFYHNIAYGEQQLSYNGDDIPLPRNADDADIEGAIHTYLAENDLLPDGVGPSDGTGFVVTKWDGYTTDKGRAVSDSYREVQLTLPPGTHGEVRTVRGEAGVRTEREDVNDFVYTVHWNEKNVVGFARFDEHIDADGKRVMVLQEVQGDWGQQLRDGLKAQAEADRLYSLVLEKRAEIKTIEDAVAPITNEGKDAPADMIGKHASLNDQLQQLEKQLSQAEADARDIPDPAPFISTKKFAVFKDGKEVTRTDKNGKELTERYGSMKDAEAAAAKKGGEARDLGPQVDTPGWTTLVMKRMIAHAVEYGFDKIVWTSGAQQVERWKSRLRSQVDTIRWEKTEEGVHIVGLYRSRQVVNTKVKETALSSAIGKVMAKQIIADPNQSGEITGDSITIDDLGMHGYYDEIVPFTVNKLLEKLDKSVRVGMHVVHPGPRDFRVVDDNGEFRMAFINENGTEGMYVARPTREAAEADIDRAERENAKVIGTQQGFEISDKIRESAAAGMPLFSERRKREAQRSERAADDRRAWYYSQLGAAVNDIPRKIKTGKEAAVWLQANAGKLGVKKEELVWSGVLDWLATQPTPAGVQDWLRDNGVRIRETVYGKPSAEYLRLDKELQAIEPELARLRKVLVDKGIPRAPDLAASNLAKGDERTTNELNRLGFNRRQLDAMMEYGRALNRKNELFEQRKAVGANDLKYPQSDLWLPGGKNAVEIVLSLPENAKPYTYSLRESNTSLWEVMQNESFSGYVVYDKDLKPVSGKFDDIEDARDWLRTHKNDKYYDVIENETGKNVIPRATPSLTLAEGFVDSFNKQRVTDPESKFTSGHYSAVPNAVAHLRVSEHLDADGKRVLLIDELQSDWAQKGRREGFADPTSPIYSVFAKPGAFLKSFEKKSEAEVFAKSVEGIVREEKRQPGDDSRPPLAPFVTDTQAWTALALKRAIAYAIDNGFDRIAWTTGEQQAERYDLSKQVSQITVNWYKAEKDTVMLSAYGLDGEPVIKKNEIPRSEMDKYIGKDAAKKADEQLREYGQVDLKGLDLKVGGEGMVGYYDGIVPQVARKLGAKVTQVDLGTKLKSDSYIVKHPAFKDEYAIKDEITGKWLAGLRDARYPIWVEEGRSAMGFPSESDAMRGADKFQDMEHPMPQPGFDLSDVQQRMPLFSTRRAPAALNQWAGETVVRNPDGSLRVMYHGTARDITEFRPQQANAIFLTDSPKFAGQFADLSHGWMLNNYKKWMTPEQIASALATAMAEARKLPPGSEREREMIGIDHGSAHSVMLRRAIEPFMPSDANIMPLYVRAENPFDYRNPEHVKAIEAELGSSWMGKEFINGEMFEVAQHIGDLERGDWNAIESPQVQAYIKQRHDSFYVRENGVTNLAVFSPNQVKSASGNNGQYSREDNDIRYSLPRGYVGPRSVEEMSLQKEYAAAEGRLNTIWQAAIDDAVKKELSTANSELRSVLATSLSFRGLIYERLLKAGIPAADKIEQEMRAINGQISSLQDARIGPPEYEGIQQLDKLARPLVNSAAFRDWFLNSKVVSPTTGLPLIVLHGSTYDISEFATVQGINSGRLTQNNWLGQLGSWFAGEGHPGGYEKGNAESVADTFAEKRNGERGVVYPVFLSIQNPMEYEGYEDLLDARDEAGGGTKLRKKLIKDGYDGLVVRESSTDGNTFRDDWVAFFPTQIKSAIGNNGKFSKTDPRIQYSEARKFSPALESDITERLAINNEDEDADPMTRDDVIFEFMQDSDDKDHYTYQHRKELREYGIERGIYREVTPEQLARVVTMGGKKYDFKLNGKMYVFDSWDGLSRESTPRSRITGQPINQTWTDPDVTDWDNLVRKMQDDKIDTKRVLRAIRDAGVAVKEKFDAYMLETNYHGRAAARVDEFADGELRKLLEDMAMRNITQTELDDYLWARHAPERNAQNAKTNPAITDGSGMTDAQSADILAGRPVVLNGRTIQLPTSKLQGLAAVARRVDAITSGTLDLLVSYGLETQQTVDTWKRTYAHYVPLKRDMESDANYSGAFGLGNGTGSGFNIGGPASKRALGSKRAVTDVLANVAMQRERAIARGEKNRVAQAVYGLALSAPNGDFWLPVNPELNKRLSPSALAKAIAELVSLGVNPIDAQNLATEPIQRYTDPKTGLEAQRINPALRKRNDVLSTRINGEDRYVFFSNKKRAQEMVRGLKNLDAAHVGGFLQLVAPVTRWFASINTQYNPVFGLTNGIRDFGTAMLNLSSTDISDRRGEVRAHAFAALKGVYLDLRAHRAGKPATSQYAQLFEQFALDGGQTGYRDAFATSADRAEAIAEELKHAGKGQSWLAVGEKRSHIFGWLSDYNTAVENAMRLASYKVYLDKFLKPGMTQQEQQDVRNKAAYTAKNLTVNFNKKGLAATQTGALYAFFNASVQGTARIAETTLKDGKLTDAGKKILYGGMMLGVLQAVLGTLAGWDDDEPPQFAREKNFIIPIPGTDKTVNIPMPLGFHVIPNIGRIAAEFALGGFKDPGKRLVRLAGVMLDAFNPIGSGTLAQTLSPTIGDPIVALAENKDWTGKSIFKEDFDKMHPTPGWTRTKDSASPPSRWMAYGINYITGGGKYGIGMASPTPDTLDYLVGQATGGTGRELLKTAQYVQSKVTGEDLPMYKVPLGVGRFIGETKGQSSEISRFYRNLERIGEHKSALDEMKHAGDGAAIREYLADNPDAKLVEMAGRAQREIGYLRRQKREMLEKSASTEQIKMMDDRITKLATRYNEMMRVK